MFKKVSPYGHDYTIKLGGLGAICAFRRKPRRALSRKGLLPLCAAVVSNAGFWGGYAPSHRPFDGCGFVWKPDIG